MDVFWKGKALERRDPPSRRVIAIHNVVSIVNIVKASPKGQNIGTKCLRFYSCDCRGDRLLISGCALTDGATSILGSGMRLPNLGSIFCFRRRARHLNPGQNAVPLDQTYFIDQAARPSLDQRTPVLPHKQRPQRTQRWQGHNR